MLSSLYFSILDRYSLFFYFCNLFFLFTVDSLIIFMSFRPTILQSCFIDKLKLGLQYFLEAQLKTGLAYKNLHPHVHMHMSKGKFTAGHLKPRQALEMKYV